jgi:hypothetical protein
VADAAYKLSDNLFFIDAEGLAAKFHLNRAPMNFCEALVGYIVLHPTPPEVYRWISPLPAFTDESFNRFKLSLPISGVRLLSRCENALMNGFYCFPNIDADEYSCASRLLSILGIRDYFLERTRDIHEAGMWGDKFSKILESLVAPHILVTSVDFPVTNSEGIVDENLLNQDLNDLSHDVSRTSNEKARPEMVIRLYNDHVAYILDERWLDNVYADYIAFTEQAPLNKKVVLHQLEDSYPKVSGRAGGKVFCELRDIWLLGNQHLVQPLLQRLVDYRNVNDWEEVTVLGITFLTQLSIAGEDAAWWFYRNSQYIFSQTLTDMHALMKKVHACIRVNEALPLYTRRSLAPHLDRDWSRELYGFDTIIGRSEKLKLDFPAEVLMRSIDPATRARVTIATSQQGTRYLKFEEDKYAEDTRRMVMNVVSRLIKLNVNLESFRQWFSRRFYWAASGGAPGAKITWTTVNSDPGGAPIKERLRLNKRGAMLSLTADQVENLIKIGSQLQAGKMPTQWSVKAVKYESGKLRSILNTSVEYYVIQAYLLDQFDKNIDNSGWYSSGHSATVKIANQLRRLSDLRDFIGFMWDYSDFNINHTYTIMTELYKATGQILAERGDVSDVGSNVKQAISDIDKTVTYICAARTNTYLVDKDVDLIVKSARGLQSGERGTSFTNTMCNEIDVQIVNETAKRLFNHPVLHKVGDKQGDDAFLNAMSMFDASLAAALFNLTGSAGQVYKINVSYKQPPGRGEFLRESYDSATYTVNGYPIRAMMGFIHGEFFSEPITKPFDRYATFFEQWAKLKRRGWVAPERLLHAVARRHCVLVFTNAGGSTTHVPADPDLSILPSCFGGIGVSLAGDASTTLVSNSTPPYRKVHAQVPRIAICIPSGEGKSTLCMKYPDVFVDHDSLISTYTHLENLRLAKTSGNWRPVSEYLRAVSLNTPEGKTLLTWGKATVAPSFKVVAAILLERGTGIRSNTSNRKSLLDEFSDKNIIRVPSHQVQTAVALNLSLRTFSPAGIYTYRSFISGVPKPRYSPPSVPAKTLVRGSKTDISDWNILRRYGVPRNTAIYKELVDSAITGGYPRNALSNSLANYARDVHNWYRHGQFTDKVILLKDPIPLSFALQCAHRYVSESLGIITQSSPPSYLLRRSDGFPSAVTPRHTYGVLDALPGVFGLTLRQSMNSIIDKQVGETHLLKIINLLERAKASQDSGNEYPPRNRGQRERVIQLLGAFSELKTRCDYWVRTTTHNHPNAHIAAYKEAYRWLAGELDLIPAPNLGVSADYVSSIRDAALNHLEQKPDLWSTWVNKDAASRSIDFHVYETNLSHQTLKLLQQAFPGVILRD